MKKVTINPAGAWKYWSEQKKSALKAGENNTGVGEKLSYKNNEFKIWSIHLPPGECFNFHRHKRPYYFTALSMGKARSYYNDGTVLDTEYEVGDTQYFKDLSEENFFIHDLTNIGNTILIFSTVEFFKLTENY